MRVLIPRRVVYSWSAVSWVGAIRFLSWIVDGSKLRQRSDINIPYFKASQCENGWGEFEKFVADSKNITAQERGKLDSISEEFLQLIAEPIKFHEPCLCIHGVGVPQGEFYDVIKDDKALAILGSDPYRLAYDFAMIQCAWLMKKTGYGDVVSFICDRHEQYSPLAYPAYTNLKDNNPNAAKYMGSFTCEDEKDCDPVQAADAAVFEVRRALKLSLGFWKGELRKQFKMLDATRGLMALVTHTHKAQLEHIVATHEPGEPFKLDVLMNLELKESIEF